VLALTNTINVLPDAYADRPLFRFSSIAFRINTRRQSAGSEPSVARSENDAGFFIVNNAITADHCP
jgi:hypothetical protein